MIRNSKFNSDNSDWDKVDKEHKCETEMFGCQLCGKLICSECEKHNFGYCTECIKILKLLAEAGINK